MAMTEETEAGQMDLVQVRELLEGGAQLVEVLPGAEYAEEHLPGASTSSSRNWTPPPPHGWTAPPGDRLHLGCEIGFAQVYDDVAGKADWSPRPPTSVNTPILPTARHVIRVACWSGSSRQPNPADDRRSTSIGYGGDDRIERSRTCCRC